MNNKQIERLLEAAEGIYAVLQWIALFLFFMLVRGCVQ